MGLAPLFPRLANLLITPCFRSRVWELCMLICSSSRCVCFRLSTTPFGSPHLFRSDRSPSLLPEPTHLAPPPVFEIRFLAQTGLNFQPPASVSGVAESAGVPQRSPSFSLPPDPLCDSYFMLGSLQLRIVLAGPLVSSFTGQPAVRR